MTSASCSMFPDSHGDYVMAIKQIKKHIAIGVIIQLLCVHSIYFRYYY